MGWHSVAVGGTEVASGVDVGSGVTLAAMVRAICPAVAATSTSWTGGLLNSNVACGVAAGMLHATAASKIAIMAIHPRFKYLFMFPSKTQINYPRIVTKFIIATMGRITYSTLVRIYPLLRVFHNRVIWIYPLLTCQNSKTSTSLCVSFLAHPMIWELYGWLSVI
jgi:hypothetical protein